MFPRKFSVRSNLIMTWDSKTTFPTRPAGRTPRQTFRQTGNRLDRRLDARIRLHRLELLSAQLRGVAHPARVGSGIRLRHAVHGQYLVGLECDMNRL
jgi:hypothetical protein